MTVKLPESCSRSYPRVGIGNVSNEEYEAIEMEFRLAAYLKVAQKRFVDNAQSLLQRES